MTLAKFLDLVSSAKNPRTLYLSEFDFDGLAALIINKKLFDHDEDGVYIWIITTKVRPFIHVLDLSESHLFVA